MSKQLTAEQLKAQGAIQIDYENHVGSFDSFDKDFDNPAYHDPKLNAIWDQMKLRAQDKTPAAITLEETEKQYQETLLTQGGTLRAARWLHQEELREVIKGRIMHERTFLRLLRKIRPDAHYNPFCLMGLRGLNFRDRGMPPFFVTSIQAGWMAEWSSLRVDSHGLPTTERYRGWRTVLATMIDKGIVTERQVESVFGKPRGPRAWRWRRTFWQRRNNLCPDCSKRYCDCLNRFDYMRSDANAYRVGGKLV